MRPPRRVAAGTIGVFAPSSPFPDDRFQAGLELLAAMGHRLVVHASARASKGYLAGDDDLRLRAIHELLDDPSIDALWAARGGYGAHRLLDRIDAELLRRAQKPIVGFSDICAIHALAQRHAGLISIHGPVITQLGDLPAEDVEVARQVLAGEALGYAAAGPVIREGVARGPLVGGCLSVLAPLIGTPYAPPLEGAILLLEDVGEATYRIDRMLTHLRLSGLLAKVAGVALGDFVGCVPRKDGEQTIEEVLFDRLGDLGVPVLAGLPIGHGKRNQAIPLGATVTLDAGARRLVVAAGGEVA